VGTHALELVAIGVYLELTRIVATLKGDDVAETADRSALVFPRRGRDTRDAVLRGNLAFIYCLLAEVAWILVPLEGVSGDGRDVDVSTKVSRQIAKVGTLLDDGSTAFDSLSTIWP
jgi:hypothetical protein